MDDTRHLADHLGPASWAGPLLLATSFFVFTFIAGALAEVGLLPFMALVTVTLLVIFVLFLQHPSYIVPSLIVTVPLEIWKAFFPFWRVEARPDLPPTSLLDLSRLVLLAALVAYGCSAMLRGRLGIVRHTVVRRAALLLALFTFSTLFGPTHMRGIIETGRLAVHMILLIAMCQLLTSTRRIELALQGFVGCVLGLSCITLIQFLTNNAAQISSLAVYRPSATVFDPNILARYLAIGIVLCTVLLTTSAMTRGVLLLTALLASLGLLLTLSRSGWLLVPLGLAVAWWWSSGRARRRLGLMSIVVLIGMLAVAVSLSMVSSRLGTLGQGISALGSRLALIDTGVRIFRDHLLLGAGLGSFQAVALAQYPGYLPFGGTYVTLSHTAFITIAAELGLAGLTLTTLLLVALARSCKASMVSHSPAHRAYATSAFVALAMIVGSAQTEGRLFEDPMLWIFIALLVSVERVVRATPGELMNVDERNRHQELHT